MDSDKGGGEARRGGGASTGELPLLDDTVAHVVGQIAVVSPWQQALLLHAPLHSPLRPLPQRLLLRLQPPLRRHRRSTRRPRA